MGKSRIQVWYFSPNIIRVHQKNVTKKHNLTPRLLYNNIDSKRFDDAVILGGVSNIYLRFCYFYQNQL